jgi:paraquat-inducible protein B
MTEEHTSKPDQPTDQNSSMDPADMTTPHSVKMIDHVDYHQAVVSEGQGFSFIWVVPIIALLIGLGLVYKAITSRGPLITISFKSADGIEAKKTKVKYKNMIIGTVKSVAFAEGFSHVRVKVRLVKDAEEFISANTNFWIVRPRMRGATVSGLDTLLSGAYVAVKPGKKGEEKYEFTGLETPPPIDEEAGGRVFKLTATGLGSLDYGSPIYYHGINVGRVVGYRLNSSGQAVDIQVFIKRPYDVYVHTATRFWSISGVDFELGANGVRIHSKSLVSIMVGGIAFRTSPHKKVEPVNSINTSFQLYESEQAAMKEEFELKKYYALRFDHTVRGLEVGDPVEFKGFPIGWVIKTNVEFEWDQNKVFIFVKIEVEEERLRRITSGSQVWTSDHQMMRVLVDQGLRAQVLSSNLLTGKHYVSLDMVEKAGAVNFETTQDGLMQIPTVPAPMEKLTRQASHLFDQVKRIPINEIAHHTLLTVKNLKGTIEKLNNVIMSANKVISSRHIQATLLNTRRTMQNARTLTAKDSRMVIELQRALREMSDAAKSFRNLADQLERNPESLIRGKR